MSDEELIYLWQTEKLLNARNLLIEKYKFNIQCVFWNLLKKSFRNIPIEANEIDSYIYEIICELIDKYQIKNNKYCFFRVLLNYSKQRIIKICWCLSSKSHYVLNYCNELEWFNEIGSNNSYTPANQCSYNELFQIVNEYSMKLKPNIKKIFDLWIGEYKNREIAKELKISVKKVSNYVFVFRRDLQIICQKWNW